jgi:cytochrome c oxidase subunit II
LSLLGLRVWGHPDQQNGNDAKMKLLKSALLAISLASVSLATPAAAQPAAATAAPAIAPAAPAPAPQAAAAPEAAKAAAPLVKAALPPAPEALLPNPLVGQPILGKIGLQEQVTDNGVYGAWMHNALLMPIITVISLFVLFLLFWVVLRFRKSVNPVASKTSHNTAIEVAWTLIPALILVGISLPSISLLNAQYAPASKNAVTVKVIGHQWYWSYEYPDHGDFSFDSNLLKDKDGFGAASGKERVRTDKDGPKLLAVDNRMVVPVDTDIKVILTSEDVIHSFAVPAFWTKMDAVPGRLNEVTFHVQKGKEGVYFGQCSELCGPRHGFMPIAVEVVSKEHFAQWIASKGGSMQSAAKPAGPSAAAATPTPETAAAVAAPSNATK